MIVLKKTGLRSANIEFIDSLQGVKDGNNKVFATPTSYKTGKINVLLNGQVLNNDDFEETSSTEITLIWVSPNSWDKVGAIYEVDG